MKPQSAVALAAVIPYAFTEQGVAMLSSVLRSPRAVQVNIAIMRTFVRLREMLLSNTELARKLAALENKYDAQFKAVFDAIRGLMFRQLRQRERSVSMFAKGIREDTEFGDGSDTAEGSVTKRRSNCVFPFVQPFSFLMKASTKGKGKTKEVRFDPIFFAASVPARKPTAKDLKDVEEHENDPVEPRDHDTMDDTVEDL